MWSVCPPALTLTSCCSCNMRSCSYLLLHRLLVSHQHWSPLSYGQHCTLYWDERYRDGNRPAKASEATAAHDFQYPHLIIVRIKDQTHKLWINRKKPRAYISHNATTAATKDYFHHRFICWTSLLINCFINCLIEIGGGNKSKNEPNRTSSDFSFSFT